MTADLDELNQQFCLPGSLSFHPGAGGLTTAVLNNRFGAALVTLAGAHVMSYRPHGGREALWASPSAAAEISQAMRGGIPLCWPWFALHPSDPQRLPIHGFARAQWFDVLASASLPDGETRLTLRAAHTAETLRAWPFEFELLVTITLGQSLSVVCTARNPGSRPYQYTGALHPYFRVSRIERVTLRGLEGAQYLDYNDDLRQKQQTGALTFPARVDNIYTNNTADLVIEDAGYDRAIHIHKTGSRTTVVWNPAQEDAGSPDVGAGQHVFFLCVESANAGGETVTVAPGAQASLGMDISISPLRQP